MATPKDIWGPRTCPVCGSEPYVYCKTASGKKANLPHWDRFPDDQRPPPRVYGKRKKRQHEFRAKKAERRVAQPRTHLPLSIALRDIERARMEAFRERHAA